jgi:WhiB family redox-sensing transcriptional regulator
VSSQHSETPEWMSLAACKGEDTQVFFPRGGFGAKAAIKFCGKCPVANDCLEYAVDNEILNGVWGGKSERERMRIIGRRR